MVCGAQGGHQIVTGLRCEMSSYLCLGIFLTLKLLESVIK